MKLSARLVTSALSKRDNSKYALRTQDARLTERETK